MKKNIAIPLYIVIVIFVLSCLAAGYPQKTDKDSINDRLTYSQGSGQAQAKEEEKEKKYSKNTESDKKVDTNSKTEEIQEKNSDQKDKSQQEEKEKNSNIENNKIKVNSQKKVLAFYTNKEPYLPSSYGRLIEHSDKIHFIAPFWFRLDPKGNGHIETHKYSSDHISKEEMKKIVQTAHTKNVRVLALVHNLLYGSSATSRWLAHEMVATREGRTNFINDLVKILAEYNFDGVNIDIEHFPLSDRNNFSTLMKDLYTTLKQKGYLVTISVPAKTGDNYSNSWSGPFDYGALGTYSDLVVLMTYDEHGYVTGPGPIASIGWVENVIKYSLTKIPSHKIMLGIPAYGFDWTVGERHPKYISYKIALETAAKYKSKIRWDNEAKVPYFIYYDNRGKEHQVWFESASSFSYKLKLVDRYKIRGIGIWRLGMEDPEFWKVLK